MDGFVNFRLSGTNNYLVKENGGTNQEEHTFTVLIYCSDYLECWPYFLELVMWKDFPFYSRTSLFKTGWMKPCAGKKFSKSSNWTEVDEETILYKLNIANNATILQERWNKIGRHSILQFFTYIFQSSTMFISLFT